ncbi:hypothetical protein LLEC1_00754 [Akanthomyces lecanii]|uniref:BHLH domain-containing protein n=1 Tax=Cordyceps confragosa TaxID=2714763 RepID=A0A179IB17_CORDF|nr:hypothetical protein LLEC1_00754 [Akanthomyces lecanii]
MEARFHFPQTPMFGVKDAFKSADDVMFAQKDLWSQPSEGSVKHHDEIPDMSHDADYPFALWHFQSPLEFKLDLLHAEATDFHNENTLLYALQRAADGEAPPMRKNDGQLRATGSSMDTAPSLTTQIAAIWTRSSEATEKKSPPVTLPSTAPQGRYHRRLSASSSAESTANWTHYAGNKTRKACSMRPTDATRRRQQRAASTEEKPKPPRDRLTTEQKRRNHIRHENKRRGLIKAGFDCLVSTVPELQGRTWPKSTILSRTAAFLRSVREGNERLQLQIAELSREKGNARWWL